MNDSCWDMSAPTEASNKYLDWLVKPYVISKAMKQLCNNLTIKIISQNQDYILSSEAIILDIDYSHTFIRKVFLTGDGTPWEYGRVIVPRDTYNKYQTSFEELGGKLIGENLLYNNPSTTRSKFEYTRLNNKNYIFKEIKNYLVNSNFADKLDVIWGRRSVFYIDGSYPLLVSEFFLPGIPAYPTNNQASKYYYKD